MQIAVLRYFLEVAERGSVRSAADSMHITASAISRHIAILEKSVGSSLFERRPRGMVLTEEGKILFKYAQRMVGNMDLVKSAVEEIKGLRRGVVRIAAIEAAASSIVYPAIREFIVEHSDISFEVEIIARDNVDVLHSLFRSEADIGVVFKLNQNADVRYLAEFETPIMLVVAPGHPLADRKVISVNDLKGLSIAGLAPTAYTRRMIDQALHPFGIRLEYTLTVNSIEMTKEFARTGTGVTILPEIAVRRECINGSLVAIPVNEWSLLHMRSAICSFRNTDLSKAVRAFLPTLNSYCSRLN